MSDFLFSINVTFPIFLVMVIGWVLHQIGMLDEHFVTVANRFNFKVTLPFMLFRDIASVDIWEVFDLKFVLFCAIVSTICFWSIWGLTKVFLKDKSMRGAFVQASFRSSAAVMGLAFISNIYGSSAMGPLMIIGAVPLYNIYSVIVLTFEAQEEVENGGGKIREAIINIAKNPIILSIFAGLIVAMLGIHFPMLVDKTINMVAQLATPLALIVLGAGFEGRTGAFRRCCRHRPQQKGLTLHFGSTTDIIKIMLILRAPLFGRGPVFVLEVAHGTNKKAPQQPHVPACGRAGVLLDAAAELLNALPGR